MTVYIKQYPEEKRKILAEHSTKDTDEFVKFLEEIKGVEASYLQKMLTPPRGFPKNKKLRTKTRHYLFKQFISKLAEEKDFSNPDSDVWNKFGQIFRWWVKSQSELFKILEEYKNDEDFEENDKSVEPNSVLDIKCFEILLEANRKHQINQETILRFYQFGYFLKDEQIEDLIENALTEKDIEHERKIKELPDKFAKLSQTVEDLDLRVSAAEAANELKQELEKQIIEASETFDEKLQKLNERISAISESLNTKISKVESSFTKTSEFSKQVNPLKSQLSDLKKSVSKFEDKHQTTESPRIAYQAVEIGEKAASLVKNRKKTKNEKDYLKVFGIPLWLLGLTNPQDSIKTEAIHIALKAFSVIEIPDTRIIDAWKAACGNNLHITTLDVGMGWLDAQDWFPKHFSEICFGEQLRQMDLDASVEEMINKGNFLWAIHLNNYDRSFPESYLPRFLKWLGERKVFAKVFLTRCHSENRCKTSFEVYNEVGQLPKPTKTMSIKPTTLPDTDAIVDKSVWGKWCRPPEETLYKTEIQFLDKLQLEIENIPLSLLRDIQSYLLLSHQVFDPDKALDWALCLRLCPWIDTRTKLEDGLFSLINQSDMDLPKTMTVLQGNL